MNVSPPQSRISKRPASSFIGVANAESSRYYEPPSECVTSSGYTYGWDSFDSCTESEEEDIASKPLPSIPPPPSQPSRPAGPLFSFQKNEPSTSSRIRSPIDELPPPPPPQDAPQPEEAFGWLKSTINQMVNSEPPPEPETSAVGRLDTTFLQELESRLSMNNASLPPPPTSRPVGAVASQVPVASTSGQTMNRVKKQAPQPPCIARGTTNVVRPYTDHQPSASAPAQEVVYGVFSEENQVSSDATIDFHNAILTLITYFH